MNYGELKTAIATRLSRSDLTAVIPDFITLGMSRIYYGHKDPDPSMNTAPLRLRSMLATETADLSALPTGFLAVNYLRVPDNSFPLEYKTQEEFDAVDSSEVPMYYTIKDGLITVQGGTPEEFTLSYYKKFDDLSADSDTNWLLTNNPNVYFYAALVEAYQHIKNDARVASALRMFASAVNGTVSADEAEKFSGSVLAVRVGNAV